VRDKSIIMTRTKSNYIAIEQQEVDFASMVVPEKGECNYKKFRIPANKIDGKCAACQEIICFLFLF
jgi:hypothetical protein